MHYIHTPRCSSNTGAICPQVVVSGAQVDRKASTAHPQDGKNVETGVTQVKSVTGEES